MAFAGLDDEEIQKVKAFSASIPAAPKSTEPIWDSYEQAYHDIGASGLYSYDGGSSWVPKKAPPLPDYEFGNQDFFTPQYSQNIPPPVSTAGALAGLPSKPYEPDRGSFIAMDEAQGGYAPPPVPIEEMTPWWLQNPDAPRAPNDLRVTEPSQPGYRQDQWSEFQGGGNILTDLGSGVLRGIDYVDAPFRETGTQAVSPFADLALHPTKGFKDIDFGGWRDLGSSVKESGGNPLDFLDIQREKQAERPFLEQLGGEVFAPSNLIPIGKLGKLGKADDAADAFKAAKGLTRADDVAKAAPDIPHVSPEELAFGARETAESTGMRSVPRPTSGPLESVPTDELIRARDVTATNIVEAEKLALGNPQADSVLTMLKERWEQIDLELVKRKVSSEAGSVPVGFAARLGAQTALGAGVGAAYGEASGGDWKTGAMVGAGIGAGSAVAFKGADAIASKGVKPAITTTPPQAATKLTDLVKAAKPIRETQEDLYSAERARRAAIGANVLSKGSDPRAAFRNAKGTLAGELPKTSAFESVENLLSPDEMTDLFDYIRKTPLRGAQNDFYTKIGAEEALTKVLTGNLPTRGEIQLLGKVFGDDFAKAILSKRSLGTKAWENLLETANVPRTLMTAWDASAPLRQGAILSAGHPIAALKSTGHMIRAMASPVYADAVREGIENSPNKSVYDKMKLYFADTSKFSDLTAREENIMSSLAAKIPGVSGSQRGYSTFLNKLRQDVADSFIARNPKLSDQEWRQFGHFINIASGRGDLPKFLRDNTAALNAAFAPRYAMSRLQFPVEVLKTIADPRIGRHARGEMARDILAFVGTGVAIMELGELAGIWKVEKNPLSTDFGKGRVGPTRFDFWAGEQQIARYAAQLISGKRKTSTGDIRDANRLDIVGRWLSTKQSPAVGLATDVLRGEDFVGEKVDFGSKEGLGKQFWTRLAPLFLQDMAEAAEVTGSQWNGLRGLPAGAGAGVLTYEDSDTLKRQNQLREDKAFDQYKIDPSKEASWENLSAQGRDLWNQKYGALAPFSEEAIKYAGVTSQKVAEQDADDRSLKEGMGYEQHANQYFSRKRELSAIREGIYAGKEIPRGKDTIMNAYYDAIDAAKQANGSIDWSAVDRYVESLSEKDRAWIDDNTGIPRIATEETRRIEAQADLIREKEYWKAEDEVWKRYAPQAGLPVSEGQTADQFFATARKEVYKRAIAQGMDEYQAQLVTEQVVTKLQQPFSELVSKVRKAMRESDPELMKALIQTGYYTPGKEATAQILGGQ